MFEIKDPIVLDVLYSLQKKGEAVIYGGYIRDGLLDIKPKDIDIATNLSTRDILSIYPNANVRDTISGHTVISFILKGRMFEISPNSKNLYEKSLKADLNINSLLHNGREIIDLTNSLPDFNAKVIKTFNNNFKVKVSETPFRWYKPFTLSSTTGFNLDENLLTILKDTQDCLNYVDKGIKIQEGYQILNSKHPLLPLKFLAEIGLISNFNICFDPNSVPLTKNKNNYHLQLVVLSYATSFETINDFLVFFDFPEMICSNFSSLVSLLEGNTETQNFKLLNQKMLLQRLLFEN